MSDEWVFRALDEGFGVVRLLWMWPKKGNKPTDVSEILGVAFILLLSPVASVSCFSYLGYLAASGRNHLFNDVMVAVTSGFSLGFMFLYMIIYFKARDKIRRTLVLLLDYSKFGEPPGFDKLNDKLNFFLKISALYGILGTGSYGVFSLIYRKECIRKATQYDMHNWCNFIMPVWLPIDFNNLTFTLVFYWLEFWSCAVLCMGAMLMISMQSCFVELLIFKINHLKGMIADSYKNGSNKEKRKYFATLINYHIDIIESADIIADAFGMINMMMIICSSIVIGLIGFQCLFQLDVKNVLHVAGWLLAFSFQCFSGQRLINATETLPFHFYSTTWYDEDVSIQKDIILPIMRSTKHLEIEAMNYGVLSMITYGKVIQSAYSFLAMLSQTYEFTEENYD